MKKTIIISGIIAALFVCSIVAANACYRVVTNACGGKTLSQNYDLDTKTMSCTDPNGGNWQSAKGGYEDGQIGAVDATFTCVWSCTAYDLSGHPHALGPQTTDHASQVPGGGGCTLWGRGS